LKFTGHNTMRRCVQKCVFMLLEIFLALNHSYSRISFLHFTDGSQGNL